MAARSRLLLATFACALVFTGFLESISWAGSGEATTWNAGQAQRRVGLTMMVDNRWLGTRGCVPIRYTLTASRASGIDRDFTLICEQRHTYNYRRTTSIRHDFRLPSGATATSGTFYMLRSFDSDEVIYNVAESGRVIPEMIASSYRRSSGMDSAGYPAVLVLGSDTDAPRMGPLSDALRLRFADSSMYYAGSEVEQESPTDERDNSEIAASTTQLAFIPLDDLPEDWLPYTAADLIVASRAQLEELERRRPKVFEAIRQWNRAGGNLVLYGTAAGDASLPESDFDSVLPEIDRLLGMPIGGQFEGVKYNQWTAADRGLATRVANGIDDARRYGLQYGVDVDEATEDDPFRALSPSELAELAQQRDSGPFAWRTHASGMVVALFGDDLSSVPPALWSWIFNTIGEDRWSWEQRQAVTYQGQNPHFRNFLIPGIGGAPVTAFQVLITLFVILIGPVSFFLAIRKRRLHYLLVVIPLTAVVITVSLFAYAIISDGLGIRQRIRSVSLLDQSRDQAVTWARLSYYAGLAPRDGLRFSGDTAVYPLPPDSTTGSSSRRIDVDDRQRLASGWLPSRTPTQFITVRPDATPIKLLVTANEQGARIENRLTVPIREAVIRDESGTFYAVENLPPGEAVKVAPITQAEAARRLNQIRQAHRLVPQVANNNGGMFGFNNQWRYNPYGADMASINESDGRMEQALEAAYARVRDLSPRSYIAVTESNPLVEPGHDAAKEEASFHTIHGIW